MCQCVPWSVPPAAAGSADRSSSSPVTWSSYGCDHCTCRWWESLSFWSGQSSPARFIRIRIRNVRTESDFYKNNCLFINLFWGIEMILFTWIPPRSSLPAMPSTSSMIRTCLLLTVWDVPTKHTWDLQNEASPKFMQHKKVSPAWPTANHWWSV